MWNMDMLMVVKGAWRRPKEKAMSTIHTFPEVAGQAGKTLRFEQKGAPVPTLPPDRVRHDQDMMYAWSIGTTSAAREMAERPHLEECPPEVYIG
jgi:hypothetical protein